MAKVKQAPDDHVAALHRHDDEIDSDSLTRERVFETDQATAPGDQARTRRVFGTVRDPGRMVHRIFEIRRTYLVDVNEPMVLIAQPNRSGGTLLAQLLDGHPELHSHPPELLIGRSWPQLDLEDPPRTLFSEIGERHLRRGFEQGYAKDKPAKHLGRDDQLLRFPLMMPPELRLDLFMTLMRERPCVSQRDVLNRYFTSLFNAWIDNQNLYRGPKRWVVAFRGRMRRHLDEFFTDYPDGRHVTCVRDAKGRLASHWAYREGRKDTLDTPIASWRRSVEQQLEARERYGPEKVFVLTFRQLITETEPVMRVLADWLGIGWDPILLEPTFNTMRIKANSSFDVATAGVVTAPLENWRKMLSDEEGAFIDAATDDLRARVEAVANLPTGAAAT